MFFITNPYLMLAKLGGSLPQAQNGIPKGPNLAKGEHWDQKGNIVDINGNIIWSPPPAVKTNTTEGTDDGTDGTDGTDFSDGSGDGSGCTDGPFSEAFAAAHNELGPGKTFTWCGKSYSTNRKSDEVENSDDGTDDGTVDSGPTDDDIKNDDSLTDLEKAQQLAANADRSFQSPKEGNILSGLGDNPWLELAGAIDRGIKSFSADEYYDPGTKEDYMKYSVRNTTDTDMVYDPADRLKAMYNPGKYLKTNKEFEDDIIEENMMEFYKNRRKDGAGGKDMWGKVKDFDVDQYRETGIGATYGRKGPGFGDELEQKYNNADYIGFSENAESGNILPYDYLQQVSSGDPNFIGPEGNVTLDGSDATFIDRNFEGANTEWDLNDDSYEWQRSMKNPRNNPIRLEPKTIQQIPNTLPEPELIRPIMPNPQDEPGYEDLPNMPTNIARYGGGLPKYVGGGYDFSNASNSSYSGNSDMTVNEGLDYLQTGLTAGGLTPGWGFFADAANSVISGGRAGYAWLTGQEDDRKKHLENLALNATSAIPGPIGWTAGGAGLVKDTATYTGLRDDQSLYSDVEGIINPNQTPVDPVIFDSQPNLAGDPDAIQKENITRYGSELPKFYNTGEYNLPTSGMFTGTNSGYSILDNNPDPFNFSSDSTVTNNNLLLNSSSFTPTQEDASAGNVNAKMYASQQAVNRSMDSFDAFTADMNKRIENPSLSMNQVDTNPLNVPTATFEPSEDFLRTKDELDYTIAENEGRVIQGQDGSPDTIVKSAEQMQQQQEEFSANLEEQLDNIPEYTGTQENLDRFDESNERGFDGDLAAMDEFDEKQEQEQLENDQKREQIDASSSKPSLIDRAWNTKNRILDSKGVQTYSKVSNMAIDMAKPITKIASQWNENKQKANMLNNAYLADNVFASSDADVSGSKGNYDVNTGIFRPDDKVVVGTTGTARFGGSFYKPGGEIEIDMNTYKQLVAAGADITII